MKAAALLKEGDEIGKRMEVVGEEGTALEDLVSYLKSELYDFAYLQQNAFDKEDAYSPLARQQPLFAMVNEIFDTKFAFASHEEGRSFFIELQDAIKNLNFTPFESTEYRAKHKAIKDKIESKRHHL